MIWHNATPDEVIAELKTDKDYGLSDAEAAERLHENGRNLFVNEEELSLKKAVSAQLKRPSVILLLCLLVIFVLREAVLETNRYWIPIVLLLILAAKEAIFCYSEYRSVNMLFRLKNRISTTAKVIRGGVEKSVPAVDIVPGDIIKLSEGDFVPADARLIDSFTLRCDESVLLGEKDVVSVQKDHSEMHEDHRPVSERSNMVYCGCHVMTGSALAVVTETGENAEIRRFVKRDRVFSHKEVQDRITDRLKGFLKVFGGASLAACILLTVFGTFVVPGKIVWGKFLEALIAAVCFYIAVVPESVSSRVACMLALGVKRLQKDNAVIFDSSTVEKLAGVTVICSDKTGTLTQDRMVLRKVFDGEKTIDLSSDNISRQCEIAMRFAALSCDAPDSEAADHTEVALVAACARYLNIAKSDFDAEFPRLASIPLTPERKIKTTVNMIDGKVFAIVRGAPDIILERCVGADSKAVTDVYTDMCSKGMRVLGIFYKILDAVPTEPTEAQLEYGLQFLGLLGLTDREHRGTTEEIALCRKAGISTVMFTGDHINTASSVAAQMGILREDELAVTGEQLDALSDDELAAVADKIKVCARFSPEQRVRMVNALHQNGETVLITADSAANHAPMAIADVGCAMGKTGTDVAKGNADVVVGDDRFTSIVKAIKNSRGIFDNFTKYNEYYVSMCVCAFTAVALCMLLFGTAILSPQFILLSSIFTLLFPIAALGFETADNSTMDVPPWDIGSKLFDVKSLGIAAGIGAAIAMPTIIVYLLNRSSACASCAAVMALILSIIYYAFTSRSSEMLYKRIFHNRFLLIAGGACIVLTLLITLTPIARVFGLSPLNVKGFLTALLIPLTVPAVFELIKAVKRFVK